jgi:hypothetical protein
MIVGSVVGSVVGNYCWQLLLALLLTLRLFFDKLFCISQETSLKKASQMFSYLRDKDVFVDAYRKQLAKRLLTLRQR